MLPQKQLRSPISRRGFLGTVAALPALAKGLGRAQTSPSVRRPMLAYVGTYSSPQGPEGSRGRGQGIHLFEVSPTDGALTQRDVFPNDANPAWLAFEQSHKYLYSANETSTFQGSRSGSVSAYAVDRISGRLALLNAVSSEGAGPAHCSVHPSGRFVFVANYAGGTVAVLPVRSNGELGPATDVKRHEGSAGSARAASGPPGSFAISGHDRPHAHMVEADRSGRFVFASDLGLDRIFIWRFDLEKGTLSPNDPPFVALPSGDGPRHFAFHPNGRWFYSLQEEASTLLVFDYDPARGALAEKQALSTLPSGFAGTNFTSEVMVSTDGKFVYAANRLHDSIAWFSIGPAGQLSLAGEAWTRGDYPRSFNIDPTGRFLYSCNQRSDAVAVFRVDRDAGALAFTGRYTAVGTPAIIVFLP